MGSNAKWFSSLKTPYLNIYMLPVITFKQPYLWRLFCFFMTSGRVFNQALCNSINAAADQSVIKLHLPMLFLSKFFDQLSKRNSFIHKVIICFIRIGGRGRGEVRWNRRHRYEGIQWSYKMQYLCFACIKDC